MNFLACLQKKELAQEVSQSSPICYSIPCFVAESFCFTLSYSLPPSPAFLKKIFWSFVLLEFSKLQPINYKWSNLLNAKWTSTHTYSSQWQVTNTCAPGVSARAWLWVRGRGSGMLVSGISSADRLGQTHGERSNSDASLWSLMPVVRLNHKKNTFKEI